MDTRVMRCDILKMALAAKTQGAHVGGSLSMVEIMAALYDVMHIEPSNMTDGNRDRLILSKGHGVMAQYAALKQLGVLTEAQLLSYKANDSVLGAHPSVNAELGIDYASGSLGMGLSFGVGAALALRCKEMSEQRVFVILGDGECNEGAVWEAAAAAAHYKLTNLVAVVDRNGLQYDGPTENIMALESLEAKWKAFGWNAVSVDGHDITDLVQALRICGSSPLVVIAHTIKGKGISFMENEPKWHNGVITQRIFEQAKAELGAE